MWMLVWSKEQMSGRSGSNWREPQHPHEPHKNKIPFPSTCLDSHSFFAQDCFLEGAVCPGTLRWLCVVRIQHFHWLGLSGKLAFFLTTCILLLPWLLQLPQLSLHEACLPTPQVILSWGIYFWREQGDSEEWKSPLCRYRLPYLCLTPLGITDFCGFLSPTLSAQYK